ncbi:MAG: LysM peptidoglycan-binding domain-containing protein [Cyclobacteriaceae bacterium]|nr:LysM peptidoglycan-binding domain-containing protein [Cyclobacteriaceae bacterium]
MKALFFKLVYHTLITSSLIVVLMVSHNTLHAQFKRDTVFILAQQATAGKTFRMTNTTGNNFLRDSFSIAQTKRWAARRNVNNTNVASALALGNNYFPKIETLLANHNLPPEWKWIPVSLSGMVYNFYGPDSRAGLWQLPHLVGIRYGLILKPGYDQRIDPEKNSTVAIQYLNDLTLKFGDLNIALMAFFNGEGVVSKIVPELQTLRFRSEASRQQYIYHQLPSATRDEIYLWNYLTGVFANHKVPVTETYPDKLTLTKKDSTVIQRPVTLEELSVLMKAPKEEIGSSNPAIVGQRIPAGVPLYLSTAKKDSLIANLATYAVKQDSIQSIAAKPTVKAVKPPESSFNTMHTVKQGDNLGRIAMQYGVGVQQLKEWNNLKSDRINVGQQLIVYTKAPVGKKADEKISTPAQTVLQPGTYTEYIVKQGDSLWSIARQFPGITVEDIMRWNNIGERIDIGQVLKIKKP